MNATPLSRLVRRAFPYRNELAALGDRIESAVLVLGVVVAVLAIPVAGAAGSEIYSDQRARAAVEQATRGRAEAVLVEDVPEAIGLSERGGTEETAFAVATWHAPDGSTRQGVVEARYGAEAGTSVPIWIDEHGALSTPPLTTEGAALNAALLAVALWAAVAGAMALLLVTATFAHRRIRSVRWEREWERIAPEWTGR